MPENIGTKAGEPLDPKQIQADVRALWATGRYEDIRVETVDGEEGPKVVFHVVEKPITTLRQVKVQPQEYGMQMQLSAGMPMDRTRAQQAASDLRTKLNEQGYTEASVKAELIPVDLRLVDLHLSVQAGKPQRIRQVELTGNLGVKEKDAIHALQEIRVKRMLPGFPGLWEGWKLYPAYHQKAIDSDLARLRSFYFSRGFFDAHVRLDDTRWTGRDALLNIAVNAGKPYRVRRVEVVGSGMDEALSREVNDTFRVQDLCSCLFKARRKAEQSGIIDFNVRLDAHNVPGEDDLVDLTAHVERGRPYLVSRIEFTGNKKYSDSVVRRNLLLEESQPLDQTLLRKSLTRLNQSGLFDPINETAVLLQTDEKRGQANVVIRLKERKRNMWALSGPVGPMSLAGPLQFSLSSRLPAWGRGILELSTYYASFSLVGYSPALMKLLPLASNKRIWPVFSLQRPYSPGEGWRSGFLYAPQLGWRSTAYSYGATHLQQLLIPRLRGTERDVTPGFAMPVTRNGNEGEGALWCDPPQPRWHTLRNGAAVASSFLFALPIQ